MDSPASANGSPSATAAAASTASSRSKDKLLPKSLSVKRRWKRPGGGGGGGSGSSGGGGSSSSASKSIAADDGSDGHDLDDDGHGRPARRGRSASREPAHGDGAAPDRDDSASDDDEHPSSRSGHLGVSSSPRVRAELRDDPRDPDPFVRAATLPAPSSAASATSVALESTPPLPASKTGLAPPSSKATRSVSPAGRFRSVFKSKKSPAASLASTDSHSPERTQRPPTDPAAADAEPEPAPSDPPVLASAKVAPTERFRRLSRGQKVDITTTTTRRPETPPADDKAPPVIVNTPPTPTDPSHPKTAPASPGLAAAGPATAAASALSSAASAASRGPSSSMSSSTTQRRSRAGSASLVPSKLSSYTLAPLTPTPENAPVAPSASGFFSSVLSAAQNATNSLSNTITSTSLAAPWTSSSASSASKRRDQDDPTRPVSSLDGGVDDNDDDDDEVEVEVASSLGPSLIPSVSSEPKEPAVKTLGMGDLSLSHLGIVEPPRSSSSSSAGVHSANHPDLHGPPAASGAASPSLHPQRVSEVASGSRNRSDSAPADSFHFHSASDSVDQSSDAGATSAGGGGGGRRRAGSVSDTTAAGGQDDRTPPTASLYGDNMPDPVQRTSSIRSAIDRRRHRGSSAVSGGTIAAAIAAANASLAHPAAAHHAMPKLTGFAVASKKRNRDFHVLFKSVPDDDYLIEDYSCALQREILAHGRLYVSEGHLCFSSNILGWVTTLVMSFDEIVSVEKRSTALVFKNGLMISTLHAKHIFASFASRDSTYDLIVKIWKLGHPSLQSSLNGVHIDETGGDKTEKIADGHGDGADDDDDAGSRSASDSDDDDSADDDEDDDDDVYDEDAEDDDVHSTAAAAAAAHAAAAGGGAGDHGFGGFGGDADGAERTVTRKASGAVAGGFDGAGGAGNGGANGASSDKAGNGGKDAGGASAGSGDFPGPAMHAPTDCGDAGSHYDKTLVDEVIPAPLGKVFSFMFGATSVGFMPKWLANDQKCWDIQMTDKKGLGADNKTHTYSYIKPLNASIGPRQTKCIVTEQIESMDWDKAVHIVCSTQNPDVPNGNIFTVKTKYCLTWGDNGGTRVQMNCTTEWTGKSWLKVPIEKAANDGQAQYGRELFASLKEALSSRRAAGGANGAGTGKAGARGAGGAKKGRKGSKAPGLAVAGGSSGARGDADGKGRSRGPAKPSARADWGVLEPLHGLLGPAVDIVRPLLTGNVMYGLLVGLLVASWFGFGFTGAGSSSVGSSGGGGGGGGPLLGSGGRRAGLPSYAERQAAFDELWRREESELWDWLEERVGLERLMDGRPGSPGGRASSSSGSHKAGPPPPPPEEPLLRKPAVGARTVEEKLREERMDDREILEAIKVTEEKLRVLKQVVEKREKE